ncbi:hypothetical protein Agabi119p4_4863 [Agaricus bisporus var. burnettii]|uniref:Nephrocystin 3-like N-terminal domain-containing protein n=1 Tax=Agaricus bisporus var. burnettii TaxID=192524 RepID=A0A8H7F483_AGABI|nr:hypothetical protein Agabi119p4_4863 [Agaricus bisporus var. burnettii]
MSGKSSSSRTKHVSSQISRFKNHVSSIFSRPVPVSPYVSQHSHYVKQGPFNQAHNFVMNSPVFIDNNTTMDNFMKELLQATIIGAEFDSSDRDPPPRCHPGTRLAIIQRCLEFVVGDSGDRKLHWVVGRAGVGKSAIMQSVAEKPPDGVVCASVFLSVNGRQDGSKIFVTIAYQLAVKCELYRRFIQNEISRDPSLLRKSLSVHFQRFIVEPFIHRHLFDLSNRFLIIVDGLDECDNPFTQQELLKLISDFCVTYPTSPIAWTVASRPEPHITSFFERSEVQQVYTKKEIEIDSDDACQDVQRFLRDELKKIQLAYPSIKHKQEWPLQLEFTKVAAAAGGLFAYSSTVIRYVGDPHYRDPPARLRCVIEVIDSVGKDDLSRRDHPMTQLDAVYTRILSNIPSGVTVNARKLLLLYSSFGWKGEKFRSQCNVLGLTEDAVYGVVRHLHAVTKVPEPDRADDECLRYFHKSFQDFLFDFKRSGFSADVKEEAQLLKSQISTRIVEEVPNDPNGMASGEDIKCGGGSLKCGTESIRKISLSWPGDERYQMTDDELRLKLYREALLDMCLNYDSDSRSYGSMPCFHALTTRFTIAPSYLPFDQLHESAFGKFRHELTELGKLKQVPLRALDYAAISGGIQLQFRSPIGAEVELSDPWNPSCRHEKQELAGLQQRQGWTTRFERFISNDVNTEDDVAEIDIPRFNSLGGDLSHYKILAGYGHEECDYCLRRLARHFTNNPDQPVSIFVDSTDLGYVELSFVDPDDSVSEWRYGFFHSGAPMCFDD